MILARDEQPLRRCRDAAFLKPSDLLPAEVYDRRRADVRSQLIERKRRRRLDIGPHLSLLFESRDTVLAQIQEIIWIERPLGPQRIAEEIAEYAKLIPRAAELTATLMFHGGACADGQALAQRLFAGERHVIFLQLGAASFDAQPVDPQDDPACPVQYVYFSLDRQATRSLGDDSAPALLGIEYGGITQSVALPAATRQQLARELADERQ